jgi:hypothetical protein
MKLNLVTRIIMVALLPAVFSNTDSRAAGQVNVVQFLNPSPDYTGPRAALKCAIKSFTRLPMFNDAKKTYSISITCGDLPQMIWVGFFTPNLVPFTSGAEYSTEQSKRYVTLATTKGEFNTKTGKMKIEKISDDGKTVRLSFRVLLKYSEGPGSVTAEGIIEGKATN